MSGSGVENPRPDALEHCLKLLVLREGIAAIARSTAYLTVNRPKIAIRFFAELFLVESKSVVITVGQRIHLTIRLAGIVVNVLHAEPVAHCGVIIREQDVYVPKVVNLLRHSYHFLGGTHRDEATVLNLYAIEALAVRVDTLADAILLHRFQIPLNESPLCFLHRYHQITPCKDEFPPWSLFQANRSILSTLVNKVP